MDALYVLIGVICFGAGFGIAFYVKGRMLTRKMKEAEGEAAKICEEARRHSETLLKEADLEVKDKLFKMKSDFDAETKETRVELSKREKRLLQKEEHIDRKAEQLEKRENDIGRSEKDIAHRTKRIETDEKKFHDLIEEQKRQLEKISGLTAEQAKELLIRAMENEARYDGAKLIKRIENETREEADKKSKKIIATAIQRYAGDFVAERTVSVVQLPNDEMKGRIIGREGRNIRALEAATGVEIIVDDTPEAIILSCFDSVRREVARLSLHKLVTDGRIHPARIEEIVRKTEKQIEQEILEVGKRTVIDLGIHGLHPELI